METTEEMPAVEQGEQMGDDRIKKLVAMIEEADAVVVGSASGMSAAGGDSWYEVNPTYLKYYGDIYEKMPDRSGGIFPLMYSPQLTAELRVLALARTTFKTKKLYMGVTVKMVLVPCAISWLLGMTPPSQDLDHMIIGDSG